MPDYGEHVGHGGPIHRITRGMRSILGDPVGANSETKIDVCLSHSCCSELEH